METRFFLLWLMNDCVLGLKWTPKWRCGVILQEVITPVTAALLLHTSTFGRHFVTPNTPSPHHLQNLPTPVTSHLFFTCSTGLPSTVASLLLTRVVPIRFLAPDPIPILNKLSCWYQILCRTPTTAGSKVSGCCLSGFFLHLLTSRAFMLALRDKPPLASIRQLPHCVCHHLCLRTVSVPHQSDTSEKAADGFLGI